MKRSEFRKDVVSGEWVLFVPGRAGKPTDLAKKKKPRVSSPKKKCLFEDPFLNVDDKVILGYASRAHGDMRKDWELLVLKNKYPAVVPSKKRVRKTPSSRFSESSPGVGYHDLLITRSHTKNFAHISKREAFQIFSAFRERYFMFLRDKNVAYVSMFHNWGKGAGASIFHPHYQILAVPIIPPDISRLLRGSSEYFEKHGQCAFCAMIRSEKKRGSRIVFENRHAIAFCPYASRYEFETRIFPKRHRAFFEDTPDAEMKGMAEALQFVLAKIEKNLADPDYNFFFNVAPARNKNQHKDTYHWNIEIRPVAGIPGGFEYDTGMEVNVVDPEDAAAAIRK